MHRNNRHFEGPIDPEQLKFLAAISTEWRAELQRRQAEDAEAERQRGLKAFVESITAPVTPGLDRSLTREEVQTFVNAITGRGPSTVREGNWNAAKHPRRGGPPNAGWWASAGGGSGNAGNGGSSTTYSDAGHATASLTAWHPSVGHHWVPSGVVQHPDIRPLLSKGAAEYAAGAYSGPTNPPHGNVTAGGIKHPQYSAEVKKQMEKYISDNKITTKQPMTKEQMKQFAEYMEKGLDAKGNPHDVIGSYNNAIKKMLPKGAAGTSSKMDDVLAAGRKYMKHRGFQSIAAAAVLSNVVGEVVAGEIKGLQVMADSSYYKHALAALQRGDLGKAQSLLTGDDSLYMEINARVGATAALNFKRRIDEAFDAAQKRSYE